MLTLNNPFFEQEISNIYPPQLKLKKTTKKTTGFHTMYLDLEVQIKDRKFITAVFDKLDHFNFHIVNFPYMDSNIPSKQAYDVCISQLVRTGRIMRVFSQNTQNYL